MTCGHFGIMLVYRWCFRVDRKKSITIRHNSTVFIREIVEVDNSDVVIVCGNQVSMTFYWIIWKEVYARKVFREFLFSLFNISPLKLNKLNVTLQIIQRPQWWCAGDIASWPGTTVPWGWMGEGWLFLNIGNRLWMSVAHNETVSIRYHRILRHRDLNPFIIFDRCYRSYAAPTPVNSERDIY